MSGIAGILNLDGSPVDGGLLARMTAYLRFRGPDGHGMHAIGHVGLGHALLRVVDDAGADEQPFTLDGRQWIVADARVDAREDLVAALRGQGQDVSAGAADAELILRAYRAWGRDCVPHLLGDFVFAIWDGSERRLFCARDHLGVRPLFYAQTGHTIVFSNSLDCVRLHPGVSRELNDAAVADFLLFGGNQEHDTTVFRDIQRLPPAHSISWSGEGSDRRRYWTLPIQDPVSFRRAHEYTDRFDELLRAAVSDRLRTSRVGVLMSGGVDSPAIAAVAHRLMRERSADFSLHAITSVYDRLVPDSERHYAGLVASHLDIPIHYDVRDDETSIADWSRLAIRTAEPVDNPAAFAASVDFYRKMSATSRVFLYGEGPDNALRYEWRPYLSHLVAGRRVVPLVRAVSSDLLMHPRVPLVGLMREIAGRRASYRRWRQEFPRWLNEEFASRLRCRERWENSASPLPPRHSLRPVGYESFSSPRWQWLFDDCDVQGALTGAEIRHPFLDVRLLQYLLALPAMPWCRNKLIIRRAMRAALPGDVLRRKKTSVQVSPDFARAAVSGLPRLQPGPALSRYVNARDVPTTAASVVELRAALRPLGLNYWLQGVAGN